MSSDKSRETKFQTPVQKLTKEIESITQDFYLLLNNQELTSKHLEDFIENRIQPSIKNSVSLYQQEKKIFLSLMPAKDEINWKTGSYIVNIATMLNLIGELNVICKMIQASWEMMANGEKIVGQDAIKETKDMINALDQNDPLISLLAKFLFQLSDTTTNNIIETLQNFFAQDFSINFLRLANISKKLADESLSKNSTSISAENSEEPSSPKDSPRNNSLKRGSPNTLRRLFTFSSTDTSTPIGGAASPVPDKAEEISRDPVPFKVSLNDIKNINLKSANSPEAGTRGRAMTETPASKNMMQELQQKQTDMAKKVDQSVTNTSSTPVALSTSQVLGNTTQIQSRPKPTRAVPPVPTATAVKEVSPPQTGTTEKVQPVKTTAPLIPPRARAETGIPAKAAPNLINELQKKQAANVKDKQPMASQNGEKSMVINLESTPKSRPKPNGPPPQPPSVKPAEQTAATPSANRPLPSLISGSKMVSNNPSAMFTQKPVPAKTPAVSERPLPSPGKK